MNARAKPVPHRPHLQRRASGWLLLLSSLASAAGACADSREEGSLDSGAGSGGAGSGSTPAGPGGSGQGGAVTVTRDAGADATAESADATPDAASSNPSCVVGTLEEYCGIEDCPALADAPHSLRGVYALVARSIVQRPCVAPGGFARISVSANYGSLAKTFVYDAGTEQLVGVQIIDDLGLCSGSAAYGDPAFGQESGYYGEASPDCGSGYPDFFIPSVCDPLDAGARGDAEPYECILPT